VIRFWKEDRFRNGVGIPDVLRLRVSCFISNLSIVGERLTNELSRKRGLEELCLNEDQASVQKFEFIQTQTETAAAQIYPNADDWLLLAPRSNLFDCHFFRPLSLSLSLS
jgi:hypothetical protein